MVNEFNYPIQCNPQQIVPFSDVIDTQYQTCTLLGSTPGQLAVPSEAYLEASFGYSRSSMSYDWAVVLAFTILYLLVTVWAAENMHWGGGGGGVTVFARTASAKQQLAETETPAAASGDVEAAASGNTTPPRSDDSTRANSPAPVEKKPSHGSASFDDRAVFTWKDVNLTLGNGRELLHNVTGYCKPGSMTALMGASGAGKTTLMTALSQRGVAGDLSGDILVDGKSLDRGFQKGTGLVLQGDVHLGTSTVREAIEFSALLRQSKETSREEKLRYAQHCIDLLELNSLADALIGVPGAGLSVEKRKRVTIGVELAAKPDLLLFLDEPTSGLDSAGAASIIRLLRRLADEGMTIL
jgi:ABC-type Mn2+/Zn2+ transport system ATPase subunit